MVVGRDAPAPFLGHGSWKGVARPHYIYIILVKS